MNLRDRSRTTRRTAGYTLIELVVGLGMMTVVIIGILLLFDFNNKLARAQSLVAEMQQSLRASQQTVVREIRMAGRGGVPVGTLPNGVALAVRNNVGAGGGNRDLAVGFAGSPQVVEGTDVLTVRGVFTAPIYQINHTDPTNFSLITDAGGNVTGGTVLVPSVSHTGIAQPTQMMVDEVEPPGGGSGVPEALILISPLDDAIFAVVEVDPVNSDVSNPNLLILQFRYTGGVHTDEYRALTGSPTFPDQLTSVAFIGILEEYRFYVREERAVPGDDTSELRPRLSRARMFPGTEVPYQNDLGNATLDIADNILDLQVALGIDTDNDGVLVDTADDTDEWLYNHADDDDTELKWNQADRRLAYVRLTTVARSDRRDPNYVAPQIANSIEDHLYGEPEKPANDAQRLERMFHRQLIETVIDMRNLT